MDANTICLEHLMSAKPSSPTTATVPVALSQFDSLPASAYVQVQTVAGLVGVSRATIWRMVQRGQLPQPKKLSDRATRWNVGELRAALVK